MVFTEHRDTLSYALFDNGHDPVPPATISDWATFMEMLRPRGMPLAIHADLGNDNTLRTN